MFTLALLSHDSLHVTTAVVAESTSVGVRSEALFGDRRIVIHLLVDALVRRCEATLLLERCVE